MDKVKKRREIEPVVRKSMSFEEADEWEIQQHLAMTPEERQTVAEELRHRVYGEHSIDVREIQESR